MSFPFRTDADVDAIAPRVAAHLADNRLLAYPTETVYGLAASAATMRTLRGERGQPFSR